jgi:GAF domain-containing protein
VFQTMLENATRICEAHFGSMLLREGDAFGVWRSTTRHRRFSNSMNARIIPQCLKRCSGLRNKQVSHIPDMAQDPNDPIAKFAAARTLVVVPDAQGRRASGRDRHLSPGSAPFTDKQIELVTNFASQAVIAIENVRLLNELRARTDDLARSVGELQALGEVSQAVNSTLDLEQVLTTIVQRAVQLSRTDAGAIYVFDEARQEFKLRATYGMSDDMIVASPTGASAPATPTSGRPRRAQADPGRRHPERAADAGQRHQPARRLPRGADHPAAASRPHRRRPGGAAQSRRANSRNPPSTCSRPSPTSRWWRSRMHGCSAKSRRRASSSRREPAQVAVPRQHEPRAAHAAQRHPRLHRAHSRRHLRRSAGEGAGRLKRVESNGRHLLGLINDVLDLSKIEAGQLTLTLTDYSMKDVLYNVFSAVEPWPTTRSLASRSKRSPTCRRATATSAGSRRWCSTSSATPSSSATPAR